MLLQKKTLIVLAILLSLSSLGFAYEIHWSTPVEITPNSLTSGTRTFTATIGLIGGPVENLYVVGNVDGTQVFEKTVASIHTGGTKDITFNHFIGVGNHTVQIIIDPNNATTDTNPGNNITEKSFKVMEVAKPLTFKPGVDISVEYIKTNIKTVMQYRDVIISVAFVNTGQVTIDPGIEFKLMYNGNVVKTFTMELSLEPGHRRLLVHKMNASEPGIGILKIALDTTNKLEETNELNNIKTTTIKVYKPSEIEINQ